MRRFEEKHYCRACTASFDATSGMTPSSHMQLVMHHRKDHADDGGLVSARCDKNCLAHEQPDEKQHGVKLYGPGAARISQIVPPLLTAEEIFGPEDA